MPMDEFLPPFTSGLANPFYLYMITYFPSRLYSCFGWPGNVMI